MNKIDEEAQKNYVIGYNQAISDFAEKIKQRYFNNQELKDFIDKLQNKKIQEKGREMK